MVITNDTWSVYAHINKINGKYYVGITSKDVEERWKNGFGYRGQLFYKAIEKYGWDNFEHIIIASNLTKEEAENFEKLLIKNLNSHSKKNGYNVSFGGIGGTTPLKPVYQFDLCGNLIKEYDSITEAENETDVPSSNIIACCNNKYKQASGFIWKYKDDIIDLKKFCEELDCSVYDKYEPIYQFDMEQNFIAEYPNASEASKNNPKWFSNSILSVCRGEWKYACGYIWRFKKDVPDIKTFKYEHIDFSRKTYKGNSVLQFDLNGNFIREFNSVKDASEYYNCDSHTITYACSGRTKTGINYLWRYKKDYHGERIVYEPYKPKSIPVLQFDKNNNLIAEYESATHASKSLNCSSNDIRSVCRGKQKTCKGFVWKYKTM